MSIYDLWAPLNLQTWCTLRFDPMYLVGEAGSVQISSDLEKELAEAVILAEDYLLPQPLSMAEAVAAVVRKSFEHTNILPKLKCVVPYLRNAKAAYRVVGYLAYQVAARQGENLAS